MKVSTVRAGDLWVREGSVLVFCLVLTPVISPTLNRPTGEWHVLYTFEGYGPLVAQFGTWGLTGSSNWKLLRRSPCVTT